MGQSGFFALDVYQFQCIQKTGLGVEEAATYLSLLRSTDQSNVVSSGGVRSVMDYSGLSRSEVKRAIRNLESQGLVECLEVERKRARKVARYNLPTHDSRQSLSPKERGIVSAIEAGQQPTCKSDVQAAHRAQAKGWIEKRSDGWQIIPYSNTVAFIPNSFVRVSEGHSPLYRLVNGGELGPIMLAAELYQRQDLMDERGVPLEAIRGHFYPEWRQQVGVHQMFWLSEGCHEPDAEDYKGPPRSSRRGWWSCGGEEFWNNLRALDAAHITEWAVYSANGKTSEDDECAFNRPQRPLGVLRNGRQALNTPESRPAFMAYLVAHLLESGGQVTESLPKLIEKWRTESPLIALENTSVAHVAGVSILRMTHRAATDNAKVWYRDLCEECDRTFFFVESAARSNFPQLSVIASEIKKSTNLSAAISMKINESSM